jgi:predicted metal-dependent peptidase
MEVKTEWASALSKAKVGLMASPDCAFFSSLCLSLRHTFTWDFPTAATNGRWVKYNPDFFMGLAPEERIFLVIHEVMHCVLEHVLLGKEYGLEPSRANVAADHCINLMLIARGFKMPQGGLADPKYKGLSTLEIYDLLPVDPPCPMPDLQEPDGDIEGMKEEMKDILVRAAMQSEQAGDKPGTIPGDIQVYLEKLRAPKLPMKTILSRYLKAMDKSSYSWTRPNRRYMPEHYLPILRGQKLMEVAVAIDASGSVSDADFTRFISEVDFVLRFMKPEKLTLITFDTSIRSVDQVKTLKQLGALKFTGRGGTVIGPVFEWAQIHKPRVLLVFTDGGFYMTEQAMKNDTIWLIHNNPKWTSPFGKVIHYEA